MNPLDFSKQLFDACVSPGILRKPELMVLSAWLEHAPFAFWLVGAQRPRVLVELGTHRGYSYAAFCQAVVENRLKTRCMAVDTWEGDDHAGFYDDSVYREFAAWHDPRYRGFSKLIRATFDDAAKKFGDRTIDLLHIDGRHSYEDVRHDFETWLPKMTARGVVLFHDTAVRDRGFGVHQFFDELSQTYPHFNFNHCNGLGVLGVGRTIAPEVAPLFAAANDPAATQAIRATYERLGRAITVEWQRRAATQQPAATTAAAR